MIVVSDSSPLITLAAVDRLDLLRRLFSTVIIPDAVHQEIVTQGALRVGADEVRAADWIERKAVGNVTLAEVLKRDLDDGEAEVIALALEKHADLVLIDERRATAAARRERT